MESFQSKFVKVLLRMVRLNKMWKLTGDDLRKRIEKKQWSDSCEPPKHMQKKLLLVKGSNSLSMLAENRILC
jgi:hypothetical protein